MTPTTVHILIISCPRIAGIHGGPHGSYKAAAIQQRAELYFRGSREKKIIGRVRIGERGSAI